MTQVKELMTPRAEVLNHDDTVVKAAQCMRDNDIGFVPVEQDDRLVGAVTDRDIAIRGVAEDKGDVALDQIMTGEMLYCYDDDACDSVASNMGEQKVRRLPVVNRDKRLVGVVSIGDLVREGVPNADDALQKIVQAP